VIYRNSFFQKELVEQFRQPRNMLIKLLFPFAIVGVAIYAGAPRHAVASLVLILFTVLGIFGSGVGLTMDKSSGLMLRLSATPVKSRSIVIGSALANAALGVVQLIPVALALSLAFGLSPVEMLGVLTSGSAVVAFSSLLGVGIGARSETLGDIHLYSALVLLPVLAVSGLSPLSCSPSKILPFLYFKESMTTPGGVALIPILLTAVYFLTVTAFSHKILKISGD